MKAVSTDLEDYILAHQPPPEDEDSDHSLTDDERLREMAEGYVDLHQDVLRRDYTSEDYDDGHSTEEVRKARDRSYKYFRKNSAARRLNSDSE